MAVPTLIQHLHHGFMQETAKYTSIKVSLPNPALSGNALIVRVGFDYASGLTVSLSDNEGSNTWTQQVVKQDTTNGFQQAVWTAFNVTAGTQFITLTFSSAIEYWSCDVSEFNNVTGMDVSGENIVTGTTIDCSGNISPTVSGDLIYIGAQQDSLNANGNGLSFTLGSQSNITWQFAPCSTDSSGGSVIQYGQYSVTTAFNPKCTVSASANWVVCALALKTGTQGNTPAAGIRVNAISHNDLTGYLTTGLQVVTQGNLQVMMGSSANAQLTGISSTRGTWTTWVTSVATSASGYDFIADSVNQSAGTQTVTPTWGSGALGNNIVILDITGAATSPRDTSIGLSNEDQTSGSTFPGNSAATPNITPGAANELILCYVGVDLYTLTNCTGGTSGITGLNAYGSPDASDTMLDQNNGIALFYNSGTSNVTFGWNETGIVSYWGSVCAAYKAPSGTVFNVSAPLSMASSISNSGSSTMPGSTSLSLLSGLSDSTASSMHGSIALSLLGLVAALSTGMLTASAALQMLESSSDSASGAMAGNVALSEASAMAASAQASMTALVQIAEASGLSESAITALIGGLSLAAASAFSAVYTGGAVVPVSVTLALQSAFSESAITSFLASCGISVQEIVSPAGIASMAAAFTQALQASETAGAAAHMGASVPLSIQEAFAAAMTRIFSGAVTLQARAVFSVLANLMIIFSTFVSANIGGRQVGGAFMGAKAGAGMKGSESGAAIEGEEPGANIEGNQPGGGFTPET